MKCFVCCCCVLLCWQLVTAESPGVCLVKHMKTKVKYVINRQLGEWVMTPYQEPEMRRECCEGYKSRNSTSGALICEPVCEPECHNSNCEAVNLCVCLPGHMMINNSTSTCVNICDSCVNSVCPHGEDSVCVCNPGFEKDTNVPHVCNPICDPPCVNGTCDTPGVCKCFDNFVKDGNNTNVCKPTSRYECVFGDITDVDECTCYKGYMNDNTQPNVCIPVCKQSCENGFCAAPDFCRCYNGYTESSESEFKCVPEKPETLTKTSCEFKISNAIRYDAATNCFLLKKNLIINDSQCGFLNFLMYSDCPEDNDCGVNFQCSRVSNSSGTTKMHCDLGRWDSEYAQHFNVTIPEVDWTDILVELNATQPINLKTGLNVSNSEWRLIHSTNWPVCNSEVFELTIQTTNRNASTPPNSSYFLSLMMILLSCVVLLLAGAGLGGFLWLRHRRQNDPLNYRGSMMRGYHAKPGEEGRPAELIPDDESEECADADL